MSTDPRPRPRSRRSILQTGMASLLAYSTFSGARPLAVHAEGPPTVRPETALQELIDGNRRFVSMERTLPHQTAERRIAVSARQHPNAAILSCSDSRVPPEIIFDQGLGDLFVVRVAGNIVDRHGTGSIEYAVEHFGVPLVLVLGHTNCGAVVATVEALETGSKVPGAISSLVDAIRPAVEEVQGHAGDIVANAVRANVALGVVALKGAPPILSEQIAAGHLQIIGAEYDLVTGVVQIMA